MENSLNSMLVAIIIALIAAINCVKSAPCNEVRNLNATPEIQLFSNDGFPSSIEANSLCKWTITARPSYIIQLQVAVSAIGDCSGQQNCLSVYDDAGSLKFDYFTQDHFESLTTTTYYSLSNTATVQFSTADKVDVFGRVIGFEIGYREVAISDSNVIHVVNSSATGTITNNNYPDYYSPTENRQAWQITVEPGNVIQFDLASASMYDHLTIYDGSLATAGSALLQAPFSNYETTLFTTSNEAFVVLQYYTKYSFGYPHGFSLDYKQVPAAVKPCKSIRYLTSESGSFGTITNDYFEAKSAEADSDCGWVVSTGPATRIGFAFADLNLQKSSEDACWGNVTIYDGDSGSSPVIVEWCSVQEKRVFYTDTSSSALIRFQSSSLIPLHFLPSFVVNFWQETTEPKCTGVVQKQGPKGDFQSSGYPYRYDANGNCVWKITVDEGFVIRIRLSVGHIYESNVPSDDCSEEVRRGSPWVNIYSPPAGCPDCVNGNFNFTLCSNFQDTVYTTPSNVATVQFFANEVDRDYYSLNSFAQNFKYPTGFTLTYEQIPVDEPASACREVRTITTSTSAVTGWIKSDYYPRWYEAGSDCQWLVTAPPGYIIYFKFIQQTKNMDLKDDNCIDSVSIYDGQSLKDKLMQLSCGQCGAWYMYDFYTSSNVGLVRFKTASGDRRLGQAGFSLTYQAVAATLPSSCREMTEILLSNSTGLSGVIKNSGFPSSFDAFSRCRWRISAPENYLINFNISIGFLGQSWLVHYLEITDANNCNQLYMGFGSYSSDLANATTETKTNAAIVYLTTMENSNQISPNDPHGFEIRYEAVPKAIIIPTTPLPFSTLSPPQNGDDLLWLWILLGIFGALLPIGAVGYLFYRSKLRNKADERMHLMETKAENYQQL